MRVSGTTLVFLSVALGAGCKQATESTVTLGGPSMPSKASPSLTASEKLMDTITIIPGISIGPVKLGARESDLPLGSHVEGGLGRLGAIRFLVAGGAAQDVWVEGLESGAVTVEIKGHRFSKIDRVSALDKAVGPCKALDDMIGGTFYNCEGGISIGVDLDGRVSQIRVKPR